MDAEAPKATFPPCLFGLATLCILQSNSYSKGLILVLCDLTNYKLQGWREEELVQEEKVV